MSVIDDSEKTKICGSMLRPTDSYRSSPTTPLAGFGAPPEMCYVELKKVYAEN